MRLYLLSIVFFAVTTTGTVLGQSEDIDEQKKLLLQNREFFLSHRILLLDYNFENAELNAALHDAVKYHEKSRKWGGIGGALIGASVLTLAVTKVAAGSEENFGEALGIALAGLSLGGLAFSIGLPMVIVGLENHNKMMKSLDRVRSLQK